MNKLEKTAAEQLSSAAWKVSEYAVAKKRKVGCALLVYGLMGLAIENGKIVVGCNIEHDHCRSMHAEQVALAKAVSQGYTKIFAALIVCDSVESFLPCGNCMDWLLQFAAEETIVGFQNNPKTTITWHMLKSLMPNYPKK